MVYAEGCRITEGAQGWQAWWNNEVVPGDPIEDEARIAEAVTAARVGRCGHRGGGRERSDVPRRLVGTIIWVIAIVSICWGGRTIW